MAELTQPIPVRTTTTAYTYNASRRRPVGYYLGRIGFWALVVFILVYAIFPFYWMAVSSLKPDRDLFSTPLNYLPSPLSWDHMDYVLDNGSFLKALRNSAFVAGSTVLIALAIGASAAYAIGRLNFRGKIPIMYLILSMTMFPQIAVLGSLYKMINNFNLFNRWPALTLSYLIFTVPFTVWVLANFFKAMPRELEEAALVDGATPFQAFYKILLPLAMPGLVTTGLLAFIAAWNEFLFAVTFTQDERARTAPVSVASFSGNTQFDYPWGNIMAAAVIVTVPLVALVLIFQRKILAGLTAGAVKG
jgi:trehalose/maltose transport system permease protein